MLYNFSVFYAWEIATFTLYKVEVVCLHFYGLFSGS